MKISLDQSIIITVLMLNLMMKSFKHRKDFRLQSIVKISDRRRNEPLKVLIMDSLLHQSPQSQIECEKHQRILNELIQVFILQLIQLRCEVLQLQYCNDDQVQKQRRIQNEQLNRRTILCSNTSIKQIKQRSSIQSWLIHCLDLN